MTAKITIVNMYTKVKDRGAAVVNTTSKSESDWQSDPSPFKIGLCRCGHLRGDHSQEQKESDCLERCDCQHFNRWLSWWIWVTSIY